MNFPTALFKRRAKVIIERPNARLEVQDLHMEFTAKKTLKKEPNDLELVIHNLSEQNRNAFKGLDKHTSIRLFAGYGLDIAQIFRGEVRVVEHVKDGPNWATKIWAGDADTAFHGADVSESFGPGARASEIAVFLIKQMDVDPGNSVAVLNKKLAGVTYSKGYQVQGKASSALALLLEPAGITFSIQDGRLVLATDDSTFDQTQALVLGPESGLVGSPEHRSPEKEKGPKTLKVKSLLQPTLQCGRRVKLESFTYKGEFWITELIHTGDTHRGAWYSEMEIQIQDPRAQANQ